MSWPFTWCEWTEWSVCSVEPCYPGPRKLRRRKYPVVSHSSRDVAMREFCVNSTDIPITAFRWPETEETISSEPIKPMHMRSRQCNCVRNEFGIFSRFLVGSCEKNDDQIECHTCFNANSTVYTHAERGGALLTCSQMADIRNAEALASAIASSNRFYAILGGALGTAAFLVLVFCCIRFFLVSASSVSSARRRTARRAAESTSGGSVIGEGFVDDGDPALRRSGVGLPYPHFLNTELPPAYKDVVAMTVVLPIDPDNPPSIEADGIVSERLLPPTMPPLPNSTSHRHLPPPSMIPVSPAPAPFEIGRKTTNDGDEASDEPPPPSYQEVIAFSPSAADMRQRIMAASVETPGSIQEAQKRQPPSA